MHQQAPARLVVVSNRLPLQAVVCAGGKVKLQPGGGGLVAAMRCVLAETGGLWIGWPGEGDMTGFEEKASELPFQVVPVPLAPEEVNAYYDGFTNRTLWPLFHDLVARTVFDHSWWNHYVTVNRKFSEVAAEHTRSGDLVWAHDFHLLLFGEMLRAARADVRSAFFLHTPFPPFMLFQRLPWKTTLARALLGYDTIGLQTERDLGAFVRAVLALCPEARPVDFSERQAIWEWQGRTVRAGVFPISVDFDYWNDIGQKKRVARKAQRFREKNSERKIILGVDRLDYSKGIPQRLRAFGELLEQHPEEREKVQFLQIAVPSRTAIYEYKEIKREIDRLIGQINGKFGTPSWIPVNYLYRSFDLPDLAAYYRAADVALVTPIKDGMNLVAKEFAAASSGLTGVLILSEFAGAAYELEPGALIVNPHDVVEVASALHKALHMSPEEQRERQCTLRAIISRHDVHEWSRSFIAVARGVQSKTRTPTQLLESWEGWHAPRLLLDIDYDGALAPMRPLPQLARPTPELVAVLGQLAHAAETHVVIASGRTLEELSDWFPDAAVTLTAGHGARWRHEGKESLLLADEGCREIVREAHDRLLPIVDQAPGAILEDKGLSVAVHYRMVAEFVLPRLLPKLRKMLHDFVRMHKGFSLREGPLVLELVPESLERTAAFRRIRDALDCADEPAVVISASKESEAVFEALKPSDLGVHIGDGPTLAPHVLRRPQDLMVFINELAQVRAACTERA